MKTKIYQILTDETGYITETEFQKIKLIKGKGGIIIIGTTPKYQKKHENN